MTSNKILFIAWIIDILLASLPIWYNWQFRQLDWFRSEVVPTFWYLFSWVTCVFLVSGLTINWIPS